MPRKKSIPLHPLSPKHLERFNSRVVKNSAESCWNWTYGVDAHGYGKFWDGKHAIICSRISYFLATGIDPQDKFVCHHCDNPRCVNPAHLFLGDSLRNNRDRHQKGRSVMPTNRSRGSKHGKSKVTEEQVAEIRRRYKRGMATKLGREYGIAKRSVLSIVNNSYWHHVKI